MPIMPVAVTDMNVEKIVREKFRETGSPAKIPLLHNGTFTATLVTGGVNVSNLGTQPFLPWTVFQEALSLIVNNGGKAERGDAMQSRLGDPKLPINSIEGHIAHTIYQKSVGTVYSGVLLQSRVFLFGLASASINRESWPF